MALITTIMVLMLCSALMVGFVAVIISDNRVSSVNNDQTQAYAAAHAGLEKLTSDLARLFLTVDYSPSATQVSALTTTTERPTVPGFSYVAPDGTSGYTVTFTPDAQGNPVSDDPINGTPITQGPYDGFMGIITQYTLTVTARSNPGAEVRMRRGLQTIAIPVFQFGMFSESDLAFHAGEDFTFGGRVHTNGNLFLAQGDGATLRISDRVTAVKDVIRTNLPNGLSASSNGYNGTVSMIKGPNTYRSLLLNEGSLVGTLGSAKNDPKWAQTSVGQYNSYIRNGDTGARRLDLPLVSPTQGAVPVDLIRRPVANEQIARPLVYAQRYYTMASLRILLSDVDTDINPLPQIVTATAPTPLLAGTAYATTGVVGHRAPLATSGGAVATGALSATVYKSNAGQPLLNGVIKIELQRQNGVWEDVTDDILSQGITGRNLANPSLTTLSSRWNTTSNTCPEVNPNAIIRLQRVRDVPSAATTATTAAAIAISCGYTLATGVVSPTATDYWPNALYDPREGHVRDGLSGTDLALGGIMQYVELDVNNLRRWLAGQIPGSTKGTNARTDNGFVVYFSDRRNNRNGAAGAGVAETGEYGYEDVINPATSAGAPNSTLDTGEDVNGNGALDEYGKFPRNFPAGAAAPLDNASNPRPTTWLTSADKALVARANRQLFFRRALKIVHGGLVGGVNSLPSPGLTIASENPVYVQGDYNATAASVVAEPNVAAAIIADSVTLLSNAWSDPDSFLSPTASDPTRNATTTGYRMAIITGKTLPFPKPSYASSSFGSDGGAHNFVRNLENWNIGGVVQRYRGSLVSFFTSRQAIGSFKCCDGDTYIRGDREWAFDTDFLTPGLLPPATPMFRDVNTLSFRQLLRPTQ